MDPAEPRLDLRGSAAAQIPPGQAGAWPPASLKAQIPRIFLRISLGRWGKNATLPGCGGCSNGSEVPPFRALDPAGLSSWSAPPLRLVPSFPLSNLSSFPSPHAPRPRKAISEQSCPSIHHGLYRRSHGRRLAGGGEDLDGHDFQPEVGWRLIQLRSAEGVELFQPQCAHRPP